MKPERETRRLLERGFEGRLSVEQRLRLESLAAEHAGCAELLDRDRALLDALEALPEPAVERIDIDRSLAAIHATLDAEPRGAQRRTWRRLASIACATAASLAIGLWLVTRDSPAERPDHDATLATGPAVPVAPVAPGPGRAELVEPAPRTDVALGVVSFPSVELPATDFDGEKLRRVRTDVRAHLVAAAHGVDLGRGGAAEIAALADRFEAATAHFVASDWPVGSIVRRLIEDPDPQTGAAAARYLALRDPRQALPRLVDILRNGPDDEGRAQAVVAALADVARGSDSELALAGLAQAVADPQLAPLALELVAELAPASVQRLVRYSIDRGLASGDAAQEPLLALLTAHGMDGALVLLELGADRSVAEGLVLDALERTPLADRATAEVLSAPPVNAEHFLLLVIERLRPAEGIDWAAERCVSGDQRALAASVLAGYAEHEALWGLLDAQESGRLAGDDFLAAFRVAVTSHPARLRDFAREELSAPEHLRRRRDFLEFLVLSERPQTVPALLELAMDRELPSADRERALLAASEIGSVEHAAALEARLGSFEAAEHRLSAACLFAVYRLGGAEAATRALAFLEAHPRARLLDHLSDPRAAQRPTTTLYKLARELEPVLDARGRRTRRSNP